MMDMVTTSARTGPAVHPDDHGPSPARPVPRRRPAPHLDMLIVGAGLSGIDAAYRFQTRCAGKSYAILEARDAIPRSMVAR